MSRCSDGLSTALSRHPDGKSIILLDPLKHEPSRNVKLRLTDELGMEWLDSGHFNHLNFIRCITTNGARVYLQSHHIPLPKWIVTVSVNDQPLSKQYQFAHSSIFNIP